MQIRSDFSARVVVKAGEEGFVASPLPGVTRLMLDRDGGEVARATTIVNYAPGSHFSAHRHDLGEEFIVLDGIFADEHGAYPPGTYVRNPPGSSHAPSSERGCTIFVKLRQFQPNDDAHIVIDSTKAEWQAGPAPGIEVLPLHRFSEEHVSLIRFAPGAVLPSRPPVRGEEILVFEGKLNDEAGIYPKGSWLRAPGTDRCALYSPSGCTIYMKEGHLAPYLSNTAS